MRVPWPVVALLLAIIVTTVVVHARGAEAPPAQVRFVTVAQLEDALAVSPWPESLHPTVVRIARCESPVGAYHVNPSAIGDFGFAHGLMQIRVDVWPRLADTLDLFDVRESLLAAFIIYLTNGKSFRAWSCY